MTLSSKQKTALEKISGRPWDSWHPEAIKAYFALTDKGQSIEVSEEAKTDFEELMSHHHWHSVDVEQWKKDFQPDYENDLPPLLFLWDFYEWNLEGELISPYPEAYLKHVFEVYKEARGYIPIDEVSGCKEWAEKLGVDCREEVEGILK